MLYNILSTVIIASKDSEEVPLTVHEAFSGILGSVSLTCWIFLLLPQVIENYRNQSAEAISLGFVIIWFFGDLCNLLGAAWAGLVPTIIAIAVYFCFSDLILTSQCLYYSIRNRRREGRTLLESAKATVVQSDTGVERVIQNEEAVNELERETSVQETEPLLSRKHSRTNSYSTYSIPGSADPKAVREQIARRRSSSGAASTSGSQIRPRRKSSTAAAASAQQEPLARIFEESDSSSSISGSKTSRTVKNILSIIGIVAVGTIGWLIAYKTGTWKPVPPPESQANAIHAFEDSDSNPAGAQFLGYLSAVLYLTARLPQIWKNYKEQSCEGLSLLFFILSLMGNGTYGVGILCHSLERNYVLKNVPWLIGSLGTMVEDVIVFWQFSIYKNSGDEVAVVDSTDANVASTSV